MSASSGKKTKREQRREVLRARSERKAAYRDLGTGRRTKLVNWLKDDASHSLGENSFRKYVSTGDPSNLDPRVLPNQQRCQLLNNGLTQPTAEEIANLEEAQRQLGLTSDKDDYHTLTEGHGNNRHYLCTTYLNLLAKCHFCAKPVDSPWKKIAPKTTGVGWIDDNRLDPGVQPKLSSDDRLMRNWTKKEENAVGLARSSLKRQNEWTNLSTAKRVEEQQKLSDIIKASEEPQANCKIESTIAVVAALVEYSHQARESSGKPPISDLEALKGVMGTEDIATALKILAGAGGRRPSATAKKELQAQMRKWGSFPWPNGVDRAGHPVTVAEFNNPPDENVMALNGLSEAEWDELEGGDQQQFREDYKDKCAQTYFNIAKNWGAEAGDGDGDAIAELKVEKVAKYREALDIRSAPDNPNLDHPLHFTSPAWPHEVNRAGHPVTVAEFDDPPDENVMALNGLSEAEWDELEGGDQQQFREDYKDKCAQTYFNIAKNWGAEAGDGDGDVNPAAIERLKVEKIAKYREALELRSRENNLETMKKYVTQGVLRSELEQLNGISGPDRKTYLSANTSIDLQTWNGKLEEEQDAEIKDWLRKHREAKIIQFCKEGPDARRQLAENLGPAEQLPDALINAYLLSHRENVRTEYEQALAELRGAPNLAEIDEFENYLLAASEMEQKRGSTVDFDKLDKLFTTATNAYKKRFEEHDVEEYEEELGKLKKFQAKLQNSAKLPDALTEKSNAVDEQIFLARLVMGDPLLDKENVIVEFILNTGKNAAKETFELKLTVGELRESILNYNKTVPPGKRISLTPSGELKGGSMDKFHKFLEDQGHESEKKSAEQPAAAPGGKERTPLTQKDLLEASIQTGTPVVSATAKARAKTINARKGRSTP